MCEIGLHAGQVFVLSSLWEIDGQSQAELVRSLKVTPPTVYNMIVRLADAGFVETKKCGQDARLIRVYLTGKGLDIKPLVENQWLKLEESTFARLSEAEKMMFQMLVQKIQNP